MTGGNGNKSTVTLDDGFSLDGWRVLPHANSLERIGTGQRTRISGKAMQVLLVLAARPGEFVSKDEFLGTVWRDRVVTEDVLTGAIRTLRRAFGDRPRDPRFIETRKGTGYRLLPAPRPLSTGHGRRLRLAAVAVIAVSGALAALAAVPLLTPRVPATVAVLPFDSLSPTERDTYLASAVTDAVILSLAERKQLRVISRTSVLPYSGQTKSLQAIARELRADYVVEGSVQSNGDELQIAAQLIDARDDSHLWAQKYERSFDNVLRIQNDVANRIARQIVGKLATTDTTPPHDALSGESLDQLLKARYLLAQEQTAPAREALTLFSELAQRMPTLAEAHLGMAQAQLQLFKAYELPVSSLAQAEASVLTALELDPHRSDALRCLGQIVQFRNWDFARAEASFRRAIDINPSDTVARRRYAWLLVALQRYEESLEQIAQLRLLDPHYYASADGALLLMFARRHDEAVTELERLVREAPASARTLRILSTAYWAVGRYEESALALIDSRIAAGTPKNELHAAYDAEGRAGVYRYLLDSGAYRAPVSRAALNAQLGNIEAALALLEQALTERDPNLLFALDRPELVALHNHPRFQAVMNQVNRRD